VPSGCIFAERCDHRQDACDVAHPKLLEIAPGHLVRCQSADQWYGLGLEQRYGQPPVVEREAPPIILDAHGVKTHYPVPYKTLKGLFGFEKRRYVKAVDGVNVTVQRGRTLGIVGESGCGKSTLARTIVGLEPLREGRVDFLGVDVTKPINKRSLATIRELQMVFQDPNGTLNPSYSVGDQIAVSLKRFKTVPADEVYGEVVRLLKAVKLNEDYYARLPRQMSGGEKQRVGIARAIASNPAMVVCDEPVSALDVSVQAAVLNVLVEIQRQHDTSMILISHDLSAVRFFSDDVAVMYLGRIVEIGPCEAIYSPPSHPYTAALLAAVPRPDPTLEQKTIRLSGTVPSAVNPPAGCRFHTRCPFILKGVCDLEEPPVQDLGNGHKIVCHLPIEELSNLKP
jgi:peptide/nickel transport system ATP-binding protein